MIELLSLAPCVFTVPTPTPTQTPTAASTPLGSELTAILIGIALLVLTVLIYAVFFFGRKLITWRHFRNDIIENETSREHAKLVEKLYTLAEQGPLDPDDPPPIIFGPVGQLWIPNWSGISYKLDFGTPIPEPNVLDFATDEEYERAMQYWQKDEEDRKENLRICWEWEKRERERFDNKCKELEEKAKKRAEDRIPKTMDVSFLGQSWTFLLEFSTVIVIIFALVILAILGVLDGTQIAPILAAIAGYVLGKTTSEAIKGKEETGKAATDRAVAEITAKKAAEDKAAADEAAKKAAEDKAAAEKTAEKAAADKTAADEAAKKAAEDRAAAEEAAENAKG